MSVVKCVECLSQIYKQLMNLLIFFFFFRFNALEIIMIVRLSFERRKFILKWNWKFEDAKAFQEGVTSRSIQKIYHQSNSR